MRSIHSVFQRLILLIVLLIGSPGPAADAFFTPPESPFREPLPKPSQH